MFTKEQTEKAKECRSVEELVSFAQENDVILTAEEAKKFFEKLNSENNELPDDKLEGVAGGFAREAMDDSSVHKFR